MSFVLSCYVNFANKQMCFATHRSDVIVRHIVGVSQTRGVICTSQRCRISTVGRTEHAMTTDVLSPMLVSDDYVPQWAKHALWRGTRTYSTFSDRASAAAGPGLRNSLPSHLKDVDLSYNEFRRSLKIFLFGFHGAVWTILIAPF